MRLISDYLKKLLYQYDCIVVPTLGAFLAHSVSASYNESTGQFLPPRRKVAFNEALRLDDGILLNYVMFHESCPREEAWQAIQQFVVALKAEVSERGSVTIDGLGMFSHNREYTLQFDPELRHNFLGNAFGLQPLVLTKQMVHPAVPVVEDPVVVKPVPSTTALVASSALTTTQVGAVMPLPVPARRVLPRWRWVAAAVVVGTLGVMGYVSVVQPNQSLQSSLNPGHWFRLPMELFRREQRPASAVQPALPRPERAKPAMTVPSVITPAEPVAPAAVSVGKAVAPASVATASKTVTTQPADAEVAFALPNVPFTVIAGSFANRANAIRFQKMLRRAGYEDAYVVPGRVVPGRGKGLIKVAAIGTEELAMAEASLDSLKSLTGIKPWILRGR